MSFFHKKWKSKYDLFRSSLLKMRRRITLFPIDPLSHNVINSFVKTFYKNLPCSNSAEKRGRDSRDSWLLQVSGIHAFISFLDGSTAWRSSMTQRWRISLQRNHGKKMNVDATFNVCCAPNDTENSITYRRPKNYLIKSIIWVFAELCSSSG